VQPTQLRLPRGAIGLPAFLPDATYGVVRSVDREDLARCGVEALVMSTFHLMQNPGSSTVKALGGLNQMTSWPHPIVTDSGGFQAYSLIRENPRQGSLSSKGLTFLPEGAERPFHLSPEKTVQLQLSYGSDIVVCLDDCRHADDSEDVQRESVERTIDWARRGRAEFDRQVGQRHRDTENRPLLFAVIQGGAVRDLRRRCAEELLSIGFDGFGFGGWPLNRAGELLTDIVGYTRELVPREFPMHALGIGHPESIVASARLGYELFDSALPTRDARHGRLYSMVDPTDPRPELSTRWFKYVYLQDAKHKKAAGPIFASCRCYTCAGYSLGYLHHLFANKDGLYMRLATIHNLTYVTDLMRRLRAAANG
jgi:queuine tRNA-ribosyltransferase